jgi:hypothetical protein
MKPARGSQLTANGKGYAETLEKTGWGLALVWIGVAIVLNVGWGAGLFGLGAIILAGQLMRRFLPAASNWFAVAFGVCLCFAGLGSVFGSRFANLDLLPILSIAIGALLVVSALLRRRAM